jgi:hypothetical protein
MNNRILVLCPLSLVQCQLKLALYDYRRDFVEFVNQCSAAVNPVLSVSTHSLCSVVVSEMVFIVARRDLESETGFLWEINAIPVPVLP